MVERGEEELRSRPTGELVKELAQTTSTLVRQEIELAKAEMGQKGKQAGVGAGLFGGAGVAALLALGALSAFLILLLELVMPAWLAALLVALLWAVVAGVLAFLGRERLREAGPRKPEQTMESVQEDVETAKAGVRSGRG